MNTVSVFFSKIGALFLFSKKGRRDTIPFVPPMYVPDKILKKSNNEQMLKAGTTEKLHHFLKTKNKCNPFTKKAWQFF